MENMKDKVAVIGMVCTKFGERWDARLDDPATEAGYEACEDARIDPEAIEACRYGSATRPLTQENTGMTLSTCLRARSYTCHEDRRRQRRAMFPTLFIEGRDCATISLLRENACLRVYLRFLPPDC